MQTSLAGEVATCEIHTCDESSMTNWHKMAYLFILFYFYFSSTLLRNKARAFFELSTALDIVHSLYVNNTFAQLLKTASDKTKIEHNVGCIQPRYE